MATVDDRGEPAGSGSPSASTPGTSSPPETPPLPAVDAGPPPGFDAGPPTCADPPKFLRTDGCTDVWFQPCGFPAGVDPKDGLSQAECNQLCGPSPDPVQKYWGCQEHLTDDLPGPSVDCFTCVAGRRPAGYADEAPEASLGGWLAHAADLERVSIDAFQILARELAHHGAPPVLLAWAARAEGDEVRHARALGLLATREGARLSDAPIVHGAPRSLLDLAIENAVEGCVRETYGALVAAWQAEHARRPSIRRVMARIEKDETSHAELAWRVHAWATGRLSVEERACVARAMAAAVDELGSAAEAKVAPALVAELGLPSAQDAIRLVRGLREALFETAAAA